MTTTKTEMRLGTTLAALVVALTGCGGSTSTDGTPGGGSGGSGNVSGSGGSGNASGSGGTGGSAATGGSGNAGGSGGTGLGGSASWTACDQPGTCLLAPTNCCGYCGPAPLSGYLAVNEKHYQDVQNQLCADPMACPDCISYEEPNYLALCRVDQCAAVDLRTDILSACADDTDCRLRWGTSCCESCGGSSLVAYNQKANLESEVCQPFGGACPPCMPPPYPSTASAVCEAGHCKVKGTGLGGP